MTGSAPAMNPLLLATGAGRSGLSGPGFIAGAEPVIYSLLDPDLYDFAYALGTTAHDGLLHQLCRAGDLNCCRLDHRLPYLSRTQPCPRSQALHRHGAAYNTRLNV